MGCAAAFPESAEIRNTGTLAVIPGPSSVVTQTATVAAIGVDTIGTIDVLAGVLDLVSAPNRMRFGSTIAGFGRTRLSEGTGTVDASATLDGPVTIGPTATFEIADGGHLTGRGSLSGGVVEWTAARSRRN